jgi:hypothetical protein
MLHPGVRGAGGRFGVSGYLAASRSLRASGLRHLRPRNPGQFGAGGRRLPPVPMPRPTQVRRRSILTCGEEIAHTIGPIMVASGAAPEPW